jgi:hypothetical protein
MHMMANPNGKAAAGRLPHTALFVAEVLRYGSESVPLILDLLNERSSVGWRNYVTQDFTEEDVITALDTLIMLGLVEPFYVEPFTSRFRRATDEELAHLREDLDRYLFRLTRKGRQIVDVAVEDVTGTQVPISLEDRLIDLVEHTPASLDVAYQWLNEQIGEPISFDEFSNLVNAVLDAEYIQLWQSTNDRGSSAADASQVLLGEIPHNVRERHMKSGDDVTDVEVSRYILAKGPRPRWPEPEPPKVVLARIEDPKDLLAAMVEQHSYLQEWLDRTGKTRHFIILEDNGVHVSLGPGPDESIRERLSAFLIDRGLPGVEEMTIRHIVIDADNVVIGDYFGPAPLDPLDH